MEVVLFLGGFLLGVIFRGQIDAMVSSIVPW